MVKNPSWLRDAVFYEIYPQSFYDSNGDGIGDIPGIIAKLDYIQSLNINAVWLNPCFVSPFQDAGYDVADFYRVAPRYGTNDDLKQLFEQAHARGIKVILDLVAGHTSIEHPWFKASCRAEKNQYSNYYIWTADWGGGAEGYRFINGYAEREGNYMINFFYCQPALNYGFRDPDPKQPWQLPCSHPEVKAVREELRRIMKFWLDMGADGFRVDMASSLVRGAKARDGIMELWHDYRSWLDREYPEAVLVSEWSNPAEAIAAGFHLDFMVHFGTPGYTTLLRRELYRVPNSPFADGEPSYCDRSGQGDVRVFVDDLRSQLNAVRGKGYVSIPTGNHDLGRIRQGRSLEELKVVYTLLLTLPGVPFIYYGDEIGMDYVTGLVSREGGYNRTGSRTPMQWDDSANAGFSAASADRLYLPLDPASDRPTVAGQEADRESLLHFVRQLVKLRRDNPALAADGEFKALFAEPGQYPLVFERSLGARRFIVAVNPSDRKAEAQFCCPDVEKASPVLVSGAELTAMPGAAGIKMAGLSYAVYSV